MGWTAIVQPGVAGWAHEKSKNWWLECLLPQCHSKSKSNQQAEVLGIVSSFFGRAKRSRDVELARAASEWERDVAA